MVAQTTVSMKVLEVIGFSIYLEVKLPGLSERLYIECEETENSKIRPKFGFGCLNY
jgi:hypothetical protein